MRTTLTTEMYIFCVCVVWLSDTAWREECIQLNIRIFCMYNVSRLTQFSILNLLPKLNTDIFKHKLLYQKVKQTVYLKS